MEEFYKNIEGIRGVLSDLRDDKYAIENPDTFALDDYSKTLYLKVLCSLVQFHNEPTEMQILVLKRIVKGIGVEERAEEYMRRALEISATDMQDFLSFIGKDKVKYYFALEGILLVSIGQGEEEGYQYLAEILELLDINKDDLEHICRVASAVLQQQSSIYDEAKALINERVKAIDYAPYIKNFYCGTISDCNEIVRYSVPDRKYSGDVAFRTEYTEKKVVFENLNIRIEKKWKFTACMEVVFENCDFSGAKFPIVFQECKTVYFYKCRFHDFSSPVIVQERTIETIIEECEFENCLSKLLSFPSDAVGGVLKTNDNSGDGSTKIVKTGFRNCGVIVIIEDFNFKYAYASAIISNRHCEVSGCSFDCCKPLIKNVLLKEMKLCPGTLFPEGTVGSDNELVNSSPFA